MKYGKSIDSFEELASKYSANIAGYLGMDKYLVFSSPISVRSPDGSLIWHHKYRRKYFPKVLFRSLALLMKNILVFPYKILYKKINWGYLLSGNISGNILVLPSVCCSIGSNGALTSSYIDFSDKDACMVIGPFDGLGSNAIRLKETDAGKRFSLLWKMVLSGIQGVGWTGGQTCEKLLLFSEWLNWSFGLMWLTPFAIRRYCHCIFNKQKIQKAGCIQELHSFARAVWDAAGCLGVKRYTLQHATISRAKAWYFPLRYEIDAGIVFPDVMYVYDPSVSGMLKDYFSARFEMGSSKRYARWKKVEIPDRVKEGHCLFATSLMAFDNETVLGAMITLIDNGYPGEIRVRQHPVARINNKLQRVLSKLETAGKITISRSELYDDINGAICVIGFASTVMAEALMLNRPVIQLNHPVYVMFIDVSEIRGVLCRDYDKLSPPDIYIAKDLQVERLTAKEKVGLNYDEVTYDKLFQDGK